MATGYISEHSAEYYLVPALKKILQTQYSHVAPMFPWLSREFSKFSKLIHKDDRFHVLVMFPRRPKIDIADNGNDSNLLIVFYVQIMPDDFVMQLHRF